MKCHNCQAKTEVEETRVIEENPRWTKRRRVCKNCGFRLWTVEMPAEDVVVKEEMMNRNIEIYEAYKAGKSNVKLAREYGISQARVSQIIRDKVDQLETRPARRLVSRDQSIAMFGTWADKVCLLVPHLQAIRAIAEEKNT
jgi:transcriptional regulator NrdR family protein